MVEIGYPIFRSEDTADEISGRAWFLVPGVAMGDPSEKVQFFADV